MTPQETDPDLVRSVQEPPVKAGVSGGLAAGLEALSAAVSAWDLLKEVSIIHHSLASGQATGREHSPTINRKLD